ncbi:hypothetical protein P7K49_028709 [Saguinus oedipus]|uniref:Uncharacterized protein n=1 Tax=Saguinus oedipus TaxID=9490 RepID=A0ABQ9U5Q9_SAGOE|nr:hypothetical protein P7K49_028709 [Saguinus oedipus]
MDSEALIGQHIARGRVISGITRTGIWSSVQMSRCVLDNLLLVNLGVSSYIESIILYTLTTAFTLAHIHYGVRVTSFNSVVVKFTCRYSFIFH